MNGNNYSLLINELAASEGIFTSSQAARLGIPRVVLARACDAGKLVRVAHGAYKSAAVPSSPFDDLVAIWKLTSPEKMTDERIRASCWDGIVVAGSTASSVWGIGDLHLSPYRLLAPKRINSRNKEARFGVRRVSREDVSFEYGFPVTKMERTLVDLVLDDEDPSLIRDVANLAISASFETSRLCCLIEEECKSKRKRQIAESIFEEELHGVRDISGVGDGG